MTFNQRTLTNCDYWITVSKYRYKIYITTIIFRTLILYKNIKIGAGPALRGMKIAQKVNLDAY